MLSSIAAVGGALSPMRIPKSNNNNRVSSTSKLTKKSSNINNNNNKTKVAVRIKPLDKREQSTSSVVWNINKENKTIHQTTNGNHEQGYDVYQFEDTFDESSTTCEVYNGVCKSIVNDVIGGYDGTIFAYGQTASGTFSLFFCFCNVVHILCTIHTDHISHLSIHIGKTYTMQGSAGISDGDDGVIQLAGRDIFAHINAHNTQDFALRVSYIEIYNEEVKDLLASGEDSALSVRQNKDKIFFVNSIERTVSSMSELLDVMTDGEKNRSVSSTKMNDESSRSHSILRITVEKSLKNESSSSSTTLSTLNLVDLAGSESCKHTGATGDRQREGGKINQSLLALNQIIKGLGQKGSGLPLSYRDSELTKLLKYSLVSAKMAVICCASPSELYLEETRSTLKVASDWQSIKTNVTKSRKSIMGATPRRSSVVKSTPSKKKTGFFTPGKKLFTSPGKAKKAFPQTERIDRSRASSMYSIPEKANDEELEGLRKTLSEKNTRNAFLEAQLREVKVEFQSTKDKLQSAASKVKSLESQNEELKTQVSTLEADKEFLAVEHQAKIETIEDQNLTLPLLLVDDASSRREQVRKNRESNDSAHTTDTDATVVAETNGSSTSSANTYRDIVTALEDSQVKVHQLERIVEELRRENEGMKSRLPTPKDTTEVSCQTEAISTSESSCQTEVIVTSESSSQTSMIQYTESSCQTSCETLATSTDTSCQTVSTSTETSCQTTMMNNSDIGVQTEESNTDEKENASSKNHTPKKTVPSRKKKALKRTPLGKANKHNVKSSRPKRTTSKPNRYSGTNNEKMQTLASDSLALRKQFNESTAEFGAVGYMFKKNFGITRGTFIGHVTHILPNGMRRVNYPLDPDGTEDLSLEDLPTRPRQKKVKCDEVETKIKQFKLGDHVWAMKGKTEHAATIFSYQNGGETAKVKWAARGDVEDVEIKYIRLMIDEGGTSKRTRRQTLKMRS